MSFHPVFIAVGNPFALILAALQLNRAVLSSLRNRRINGSRTAQDIVNGLRKDGVLTGPVHPKNLRGR